MPNILGAYHLYNSPCALGSLSKHRTMKSSSKCIKHQRNAFQRWLNIIVKTLTVTQLSADQIQFIQVKIRIFLLEKHLNPDFLVLTSRATVLCHNGSSII